MGIRSNLPPLLRSPELMELLDNLSDVQFWLKDKNGQFVDSNAAFATALGMPDKESLRGKTDFDVSPYPLAKEYAEDDRKIIQTGEPIHSKMELVSDGNNKLLQYSTSKIPIKKMGGEIWGTMGFTRRIIKSDNIPATHGNINEIARYINQKFSEKLSIAELAKKASLSVVQFERNFKKAYHVSPLKYINTTRIKAACDMLQYTNLSVGEIAEKTGFRSQSYFTKQFFKKIGKLPKDFRSGLKE